MIAKRILLLCAIFIVCFAAIEVVAAEDSAPAIECDVKLLRGQNFYRFGDSSLFTLTSGRRSLVEGATLLTSFDGQMIVVTGEDTAATEFRLKENTSLALQKKFSCEVRKGTVGFRLASESEKLAVATPHVRVEATAEAIFVIKVNSVLTRIGVIKGKIDLFRGNNLEPAEKLPAGREIAAAQGRLSQLYSCSDELRYTWYWTTPEKEPALQLE